MASGVLENSPLALHERMMREVDFAPVIRTMLREGSAKDPAEASYLLEAFLQWIAMIPNIKGGMTFVMLRTPVDEVFHAFILNTEFYQSFCERFFGFFIHHNPLDGEEVSSRLEEGVKSTLDLLNRHYGDSLHPELKLWREQVAAGAYAVSCVKCDYTDEMGKTVASQLPGGGRLVH